MKFFAVFASFVIALVGAGYVAADESSEVPFVGAYLLIQDDQFQRILTLHSDGTVSQTSDQEPLLGFTSGQGTWKAIGPVSVRARVIDFAYETGGSKPIGPALITYDLAFSNLVSGRYQSVSGIYAGEQFNAGQDPLSPSEPPIQTFGIAFKGQRVTAE